jgi:hypothetical protein
MRDTDDAIWSKLLPKEIPTVAKLSTTHSFEKCIKDAWGELLLPFSLVKSRFHAVLILPACSRECSSSVLALLLLLREGVLASGIAANSLSCIATRLATSSPLTS